MQSKKRVYVALSGGVDSSVVAALLQERNYDVHGVFIEVWQPDFLPCSQEEDRKSALRVAAHLGIPFYTLDARQEYKKDVVDAMVHEYTQGRTPNPDVWCNRYIKFGALSKWIQQRGGGLLATGHYAQIEHRASNVALLRGVDTAKDQSYFLWQLTQKDLFDILFPVGHLPKKDVRSLAVKYGLPTATRKDSQGLCFMGTIDMKDFLSHFIPQAPGTVYDTHGNAIGTHEGALFYTRGQRHGFTLSNKDTQRTEHYVVSKDIQKNSITVSAQNPIYENATSRIVLQNINEIQPLQNSVYDAQIRYHGTIHSVRYENGSIHDLPETPASGQSIVLYKGAECMGGGVVS